MKLKRALNIIWLYAKIGQQISWEYRFGYFFRIFRIFMDIGTALFLINVYFSKTISIGGWTQAEAFLVYALYQLTGSIHNFLFADNFEDLSHDIRKGNFDSILLKPADSLFLVSFRRTFPSNVYRILISIVILYYSLSRLHLTLNPTTVAYSLLLFISGFIIFYSLVVILTTTSFWTYRGEVVSLLDTLFSVSRYPVDIFSRGLVKLFTLIPVIFIVTIPAKILLNKPDSIHYFTIPIAVSLFVISRKFWNFALRHYSSASS